MITIKVIESQSNLLIKEIKKLKNKKSRYEMKLYVAEGESLVREVLTHCPDKIQYILFTDDYKNNKILSMLSDKEKLILVNQKVFEGISDTKTPQGIMAVVKIDQREFDIKDKDFIIYLDNVSDPGNLGTIIRTADASGADAVILSPECADLYNSKTVRATMGSIFHIDVIIENKYLSYIDLLLKNDFNVFAGALDTKNSYYDCDFKEKTVLCLGNEAHGISEKLMSKQVRKIKIPIPGKAESLNVAIAGAVLMYEVLRQRNGL